MPDSATLELIRTAANAPAATPLIARLQTMLLDLLPLHEQAQSASAGETASEGSAYEPSREEINAFRDAVETAQRYGYGQDDIRCIAEGLKAVRKLRA